MCMLIAMDVPVDCKVCACRLPCMCLMIAMFVPFECLNNCLTWATSMPVHCLLIAISVPVDCHMWACCAPKQLPHMGHFCACSVLNAMHWPLDYHLCSVDCHMWASGLPHGASCLRHVGHTWARQRSHVAHTWATVAICMFPTCGP